MTPRRVDPATEPTTLEAMDAVMQQAYGRSTFGDSIDRFVAAQPDGLAVIELDGRVIGTGCCVAYSSGAFGWIGLIATEPGFERRGVATAITELLSDVLNCHGCAPVLDASAAGAPVYERMGFDDFGKTTVMSLNASPPTAVANEPCDPITASELAAIVDFDAECFGAPRARLLAKLFEQQPGRAFMLRRGGRLAGYLVAQDSTLGPVIAVDTAALHALMAAVRDLDFAAPPRIHVPPESRHVDALLGLGFVQSRQLRHMRRGIGELPGRRGCIAGMVSLGEG